MADAKQRAPQTRAYTVVRTQQGGKALTVVHSGKEARTQEHACDQVVESLPPAERNGWFGAFLAGSYREFEYHSAQTTVTTKTIRPPSFAGESSGAGTLPASDAKLAEGEPRGGPADG